MVSMPLAEVCKTLSFSFAEPSAKGPTFSTIKIMITKAIRAMPATAKSTAGRAFPFFFSIECVILLYNPGKFIKSTIVFPL